MWQKTHRLFESWYIVISLFPSLAQHPMLSQQNLSTPLLTLSLLPYPSVPRTELGHFPGTDTPISDVYIPRSCWKWPCTVPLPRCTSHVPGAVTEWWWPLHNMSSLVSALQLSPGCLWEENVIFFSSSWIQVELNQHWPVCPGCLMSLQRAAQSWIHHDHCDRMSQVLFPIPKMG